MRRRTIAESAAIILVLTAATVIAALASGTAKKENDTVAAGIERGKTLFNAIGCAGCHVNGGTTEGKVPTAKGDMPIPSLRGVAAHYPAVRGSTKTLITLGDQNNRCLQGALQKEPFDSNSQEYVDLIAYLTSLSEGVPIQIQASPTTAKPVETKPESAAKPEAMAGKSLFETKCSVCHNLNRSLQQVGKHPPDWWAATVKRMQAKGAPGKISDQDATIIADYLNSLSRGQ
jgi:thiosulfate dehydrogenase